eukprot:7382167-Prymnesium_polylepis.5
MSHAMAMPAEHHMPGGHKACPVRRATGASTGVLMLPGCTTAGCALPKPSQKKEAPPHKVGTELPGLDHSPGAAAVHCDNRSSLSSALNLPAGQGVGTDEPASQ